MTAGSIVPNESGAAFAQQAELDSLHLAILASQAKGDGVSSGLTVAANGTPNMTVIVSSGLCRIGGGPHYFFGTYTVTVPTANATNPRFDIVYANDNGEIKLAQGTAAASPDMPGLPTNSVALASVYVPANDTAIANNQIINLGLTSNAIRDLYDYRLTFGPEFSWWRQKLAGVFDGSGKARIAVIADSMFEGAGPTTVAKRPMNRLRDYIQRVWRPGGRGYVPGSHAGGIANEWTITGTQNTHWWDLEPFGGYGYGLGRHSIGLSTGGAMTITEVCDRFQIMYTQGSSSGGMRVTIDGVAQADQRTFNATVKSGRVWDSGALTRGTHTIKVEAVAMSAPDTSVWALVEGIMFYDGDYSVGVEMLMSAHSGYQASAFGGSVESAYHWADIFDTKPPDLLIIEFGLNEMANGAVTQASFKQALKDIVTTAKTRGGYTHNPSVVLVPLWAPYSTKQATQYDGTWVSGQNTFRSEGGHLSSADNGKTITGTGIPGSTTLTYIDRYSGTLSANASSSSGTGVGAYTIVSRTATWSGEEWAPFRQAMYDVAKEMYWAVWDMFNVFGQIDSGSGLSTDGTHPSDKGAAAIATELCILLTGSPPNLAVPTGIINAKGDLFAGTADNTVGRVAAAPVDGMSPVSRAGSAVGIEMGPAVGARSFAQYRKLVGTAAMNNVGFSAVLVVSAAFTNDDALTDGPFGIGTTGSTSGNNHSAMVTGSADLVRPDWNPDLTIRHRTGPSLSNVRLWVGYWVSTPVGTSGAQADNPAIRMAAFRYSPGDSDSTAYWRCITCDGTSSTKTVLDGANNTATLAVTTDQARDFRILLTSSAAYFYADGVLVATHTTNLPGSTQSMQYGQTITTLSGNARIHKMSRLSLSLK